MPCPDQLWVPPSSYPIGTGALTPGVKRLECEAKLRLRMHRVIPLFHINLHGMVLT